MLKKLLDGYSLGHKIFLCATNRVLDYISSAVLREKQLTNGKNTCRESFGKKWNYRDLSGFHGLKVTSLRGSYPKVPL